MDRVDVLNTVLISLDFIAEYFVIIWECLSIKFEFWYETVYTKWKLS